MASEQAWTAALGLLGIVAAVVTAVFTQIHQGRLQAERDGRAAQERRAERWERERLETYKRFLDFVERSAVLQRGLGRDSLEERQREQRAVLWEGMPVYSAVFLVAPPEVADAIRRHDSAAADVARAWDEHWSLAKGDPKRPEALEQLRAANRAVGRARREMTAAIRRDLGLA